MSYSVEWTASAEARLTELWISSRRAKQITSAADELDRSLAERPIEIGESRVANFRVAFHAPLAITYFVDETNRRVTVMRVWLI